MSSSENRVIENKGFYKIGLSISDYITAIFLFIFTISTLLFFIFDLFINTNLFNILIIIMLGTILLCISTHYKVFILEKKYLLIKYPFRIILRKKKFNKQDIKHISLINAKRTLGAYLTINKSNTYKISVSNEEIEHFRDQLIKNRFLL